MYAVKIITVDKSRELEHRANEGGLSFATMMENAGRETAEAIRRRIAPKGRCVVVLVGPGNNGGDGLVAAHYLWTMGARVTCYLWKRSGEDDPNLQRVEEDGLPILWAEDDDEFEALRGLLSGADVVIDALLGVGVSLPIRDNLARLLDQVQAARDERLSAQALAPVVLALVVVGLGAVTGGGMPMWAAAPAASTVLLLFLTQTLTSGLEEPGWRGFALPLMQRHMTAESANWRLGFVWAAWHLPFMLYLYRDLPVWALPLTLAGFAMSIVAMGFVHAWVVNSTGSVALNVLLHGWANVTNAVAASVKLVQ